MKSIYLRNYILNLKQIKYIIFMTFFLTYEVNIGYSKVLYTIIFVMRDYKNQVINFYPAKPLRHQVIY